MKKSRPTMRSVGPKPMRSWTMNEGRSSIGLAFTSTFCLMSSVSRASSEENAGCTVSNLRSFWSSKRTSCLNVPWISSPREETSDTFPFCTCCRKVVYGTDIRGSGRERYWVRTMLRARMASTTRKSRRPPNGRMGGCGFSPPPPPSTFQGVGRSFSDRGAGERGTTSSARDRPGRARGGAPLGADTLADALAAVCLELGVELADVREDVVRDGLLVLPRRGLDPLVEHGLPVVDGDLREVEAPPVPHPLGAVDGDGHDRGAGARREPPDPGLDLAGEVAGAGPPALAVHGDRAAALEHRLGGDEGLLVRMAAADREDAPVRVDELERLLEHLRLGHEPHLPAQEDRQEEVVHEREVVRREDHRAGGRDVIGPDAARPEEDPRVEGRAHADELVDGVGLPRARALVEPVEVRLRARVLVDLRLHLHEVRGHRCHDATRRRCGRDTAGGPADPPQRTERTQRRRLGPRPRG